MDNIPDYNELHAEHERRQAEKLKKFPKCDYCGERITDDYFYDIEGTYFHESCLNEEYRKNTDDYIEEEEI